jgi:hypothetical protein
LSPVVAAHAVGAIESPRATQRYARGMRLAFALALLALTLTACGRSDSQKVVVGGEEARELLEDRNWLDRWPSTKDDRLRVYRFTPDMGGGVFQDRTLFRGEFELFNYEAHTDRIRFRFPDADEVITSRYRIERVHGPEPFDLRLTLDPSPRGPAVYYGRSAETGATPLRELFE